MVSSSAYILTIKAVCKSRHYYHCYYSRDNVRVHRERMYEIMEGFRRNYPITRHGFYHTKELNMNPQQLVKILDMQV